MPVFKKPQHFKGLDCSGKNKVLPPTFPGIKEFVRRYGEAQAATMFPQTEDASPDKSKDIVRDFLNDLDLADKVERQTLINEFGAYIKDLEDSLSEPPAPAAAPASEGAPTQPKNDKEGEGTEPTAE